MGTTVQAILQEHYAAFAATHPLASYQRRAAEAMRDCRTAALGGHWRSCPEGHVHTAHFNSCKHRNCPQCAALGRERWLAAWKERLLDCPHVHTVFTTPQELVPLWRYNKKRFTDCLFHAAVHTLTELLGDPKWMGGLPGILAAVHTWSQELIVHPHVHVLVTWGGLTADGAWVKPKKKCLLPRAVPMKLFRGKLLASLRKALNQGRLVVPPDTTAARLRGLLNRLGRVTWNVLIPPRYAHGRGVATYLACYLKGGPLGNGRLLDCRDGMVRFWCRKKREPGEAEGRGPRKLLPLPVDQFLARLLEHVPPPSLQMVRAYGLYAGTKKAEWKVARQHFRQPPNAARPKITWRDLCARLGHPAATVCPVCGAPLVVHGRFPASRSGLAWPAAAAPSPPTPPPAALAQPPPAQVA